MPVMLEILSSSISLLQLKIFNTDDGKSLSQVGDRDILVLWLIDPDPDPTPFSSDFKDAKQIFFSIFFSYKLPTGTLSSV